MHSAHILCTFEMNCVCVLCSQSVADFTDAIVIFPSFTTASHTQNTTTKLQSIWVSECSLFSGGYACCSTFKVSTGVSHFSTAFGQFPGALKSKNRNELSKELEKRTNTKRDRKKLDFQTFWDFRQYIAKALNFICSEYEGMDAWMEKIDSNWSKSSMFFSIQVWLYAFAPLVLLHIAEIYFSIRLIHLCVVSFGRREKTKRLSEWCGQMKTIANKSDDIKKCWCRCVKYGQ